MGKFEVCRRKVSKENIINIRRSHKVWNMSHFDELWARAYTFAWKYQISIPSTMIFNAGFALYKKLPTVLGLALRVDESILTFACKM